MEVVPVHIGTQYVGIKLLSYQKHEIVNCSIHIYCPMPVSLENSGYRSTAEEYLIPP